MTAKGISAFDAAQTCPAFVEDSGLKVEPLAVNAAQFVCLFFQQAGEDDAAAGFGAGGEHFAEHTQGIGEDVGDDDVELSLRQTVGQVELCINVVLCGVVFAGADRLFVNIDADGRTYARCSRILSKKT